VLSEKLDYISLRIKKKGKESKRKQLVPDKSTNEIAVIGELNVDLVASGLKTEPKLGQEVLARDFEITLGSASAIFASGIARLGRSVTFVSRVGRDKFGRFCLDTLGEKGISADSISVTDKTKTGVTVVLSTPKDRALVTYLGAIAELSYNDVPLEVLDGHRHLHLTSYYLQTALQPDFPRLMALAKQKGLTTSFDPNSDPDQTRNENVFDAIRETDILFVNEQEAKLLTELDDVRAACLSLGKLCSLVVVKLGAKGSVAYQNGEFVTADGFKVVTIDTTGAGDSFAAGFVHAYLDGEDLRKCLIIGNACGALSTLGAGGTTSQPDKSELERFIGEALVNVMG
jgi:sugar/nucleoside kinase (ribokinase family)